jgi:hypothetical protein
MNVDVSAELDAKEEEFWNHIAHGIAAGLNSWAGKTELEKRDEEFLKHLAKGVAAGLHSWMGKSA